jgi:hypothetical protein
VGASSGGAVKVGVEVWAGYGKTNR